MTASTLPTPAAILVAAWVAALPLPAAESAVAEEDRAAVEQPAPPPNPPAEVRVDRGELDRSGRFAVASYADALEEVRHSVVSVYSSKAVGLGTGDRFDDPFWRRFFGPGYDQPEDRIQRGLGSGVIVSANGYILTNNHVVEGSDSVRVALPDGREMEARLVGTDPRTDVAVLKIDLGGEALRHATLADSDQIRVGDVVFAVGNPLGVGQTTTMGIISATGRSNLGLIDQGYENFIQTDASINPGNSGGALVDAHGRVVGINTAIISTSRGNIGIGFAIPVNLAGNIMQMLIRTGSVSRGFLGVSLQDFGAGISPEDFGIASGRGVIVIEVQPGSPAEQAGLKRDDVIRKIGDRTVNASADLRLTVSQLAPGTSTTLTFVREGTERTTGVVLGQLDEDTDFSGIPSNQFVDGIRVSSITPELRQQFELGEDAVGVVVVESSERSRYAQYLPVGAVIEQINRQTVGEPRRAREALQHGRNILLVKFRGTYRYVPLTVN